MTFLTRYIFLSISLILSIFLLVHLRCSLKKNPALDYQTFREKLEKPQIEQEKIAKLRERLLHPKPPEKPKNFNSTIGHRFYQPFAWTLLPKNNTCGPNVTTLIVVHSANQYSLYRKAIRETYGKKKYQEMFNYRLFFAEGKSENLTKEAKLRKEAAQHQDIIQADFIDSYRNLTIKYLMWMRYVRDFCPHAELVLKIDDDILVDIFWLFEKIRTKKISKDRCFTCRVNHGKVIRDTTHKWYVSKDAMPEDAWNVYCSGMAVIQDAKMSGELVEEAEHDEHYISVDDAYVTGTLAYKIRAIHNFDYGMQYEEYSRLGEERMVAKDAVFVSVSSIAQMRRIFAQLEILYDMKTDPPDY